MADGDRARMADRFTELSLRHAAVEDVLSVAREWASSGDTRTSTLAVQVLGTAVLDPTSGWRARRRVYAWTREAAIPARLAGAVISLCENVLGPVYPEAAMVRPHHLTRHSDDTIGTSAVEALLRLGSGPWLLNRVVANLVDGKPGRDVELFGGLVEPGQPLGVDERDLVRSGWHAALSRAESEPLLRTWLSSMSEDALDVLVEACHGQTALLGRVRTVAVGWIAEDPATRRPTGRLLDTKIDAVMHRTVMG
jgi:hypothetical protein